MNVVWTGNTYDIYSDGVQTAKELPPLVYDVCFTKQRGFFLTSRPPIKMEEEKIYGSYERKVEKVLAGYESVTRNFGAILSGPKGVGKTLFTKVLTDIANRQGYPIVIVSNWIPGIASFLSGIEQDVIVLFDEFEKTFEISDDRNPQTEMLSLFDGLDGGHKLFILTCNNTHKLSDYMLNRPGRFHYHFTLDTPNSEEIRAYLVDKLKPEYYDVIDNIVAFATFGKITYDCLRAIAFEVNRGYSLEEALEDLNLRSEEYVKFDIIVEFNNGSSYNSDDERVYCNSSKVHKYWVYPMVKDHNVSISVKFSPRDMKIDPQTKAVYIPAECVKEIYYDKDEAAEAGAKTTEKVKEDLKSGIKRIKLLKTVVDNYKYKV